MSKLLSISELYQLAKENKGLTLDANTMPYNGVGYAVSLPNHETIILESEFNLDQFSSLLARYTERLQDNQNIGLWYNAGSWYFDISEVYPNIDQAIQIGIARKQIAIFDYKDQVSVYIQ